MSLQLSDEISVAEKKNSSTDKILAISAILISLCLISGFLSYFFFNSRILQEIFFLALIIPVLLLIIYGRTNVRSANRCFGFSLFYLIPVLISYLLKLLVLDNNNISEAVIVANLFYVFYVAAIFGNTKPYDLLPSILKYVFIFSSPVFIYVLISQTDAYHWGRWVPYGHQPNWWGMMILGAAWGATALKNLYLRVTVFFLVLMFMIELQTRGSIAALMPVFVFSYGLFFPLTHKRLFWLFALLLTVLIIAVFTEVILNKGIMTYAIEYIMNDVLLFNDPRRGMGTGLTGRTEGYLIAWNDFLGSPLFGNGFGEYKFVHNGFLLTLAETGMFGLAGIVFLFVRSLRGMLKQNNWILFGLLLSYIVILLTFPRTFNINITGILLLIIIMKCSYEKTNMT